MVEFQETSDEIFVAKDLVDFEGALLELGGENIMNGPTLLDLPSLGLISFDGACKAVRRPMPKKKIVKVVKDLGELGVINPSYFACLNSKKGVTSIKLADLVEEPNDGEYRFLGGSVLCCESLTDSDVLCCNIE